tara:strand:+ start:361 stop:735 length:375 start_codon:yes stop_codon:yes gene_type:complete
MFKNIFKPKLWKPIMIENSKVPVWLSKVAPIEIWALSFGTFVWCRGVMSDETKRHETIHFQQQLELLFVGQWILYGIFFLHGYLKYRNGAVAYMQNPFEVEAYKNDKMIGYLETRKRFAWARSA